MHPWCASPEPASTSLEPLRNASHYVGITGCCMLCGLMSTARDLYRTILRGRLRAVLLRQTQHHPLLLH